MAFCAIVSRHEFANGGRYLYNRIRFTITCKTLQHAKIGGQLLMRRIGDSAIGRSLSRDELLALSSNYSFYILSTPGAYAYVINSGG